MLKNNFITNESIPEKELMSVQISKISGRLASPSTPSQYVVSTLKYINSPALATDDGALPVQYDSMCNGQLSPYPPPEDTKNGYLIKPTSFMPNGMDLSEITQWWKDSMNIMSGVLGSGKVDYNMPGIFVQSPSTMCEGRITKEDTTIQVQVSSPTE